MSAPVWKVLRTAGSYAAFLKAADGRDLLFTTQAAAEQRAQALRASHVWAGVTSRARRGDWPRHSRYTVVEVHACQSCESHPATETRFGAPVCQGCAHMIDAHGARLHDAHTEDPCGTREEV